MKRLVAGLTAALFLAGCGGEASSPPVTRPVYPPNVDKHDLPYDFPAVVTWCSHGFRIWSQYLPRYYSGDGAGLALTSQLDPKCKE